jgi:hypothetical protein
VPRRFDKQLFQLLYFIWRYDDHGRGELERALGRRRSDQRIIRLKSRRDAVRYLASLNGANFAKPPASRSISKPTV